ncbi:hypothetical protein HYU13_03910 [Candidatus Woesearchaeota archaeon]|nr:hypothetical protein [Candidatus Woesearchaeota archaeon]
MSKEKFLKAYANLPVPERSQVIAIVDGKTFSWDAAFPEVSSNTALGRKILQKIEALGIV